MSRGLRWDRPRGANNPGWSTLEDSPTDSDRMPFGRYKGKTFVELPWGYLGWLMENCENMKPHVLTRIKVEIFRRLRETL